MDTNTTLPVQKVDTLTVKGSLLQGHVTGLTVNALRFDIIYGRGSILIDYKDIEQILTENSYHIFYDGKEMTGKITGIYEHKWLVVENQRGMQLIEIALIDRFVIPYEDDSTPINFLHNTFPYMNGNVNLGVEFEEGDINTREVDLSMRLEYQRQRTRMIFNADYQFDTKSSTDENGTELTATTKDEYSAELNAQRFFSLERNGFSFVTVGAERDAIRKIQARWYPAIGAGYRFNRQSNQWISFLFGLGGVEDHYYDYDDAKYAAVYLGSEGQYVFDNDMSVLFRMRYMPSIMKEKDLWLFRSSIEFVYPMSQLFSLRVRIEQVDDSNAVDAVENNKITSTFLTSMTF